MPASVAACIRRAIEGVDGSDSFRRLLREIAAQPGRALARDGSARWPRFVLGTCEALGGERRRALWPAAAVELAVCAADATDDLADGEWDGSEAWPRGVNAALALAWLSQQCAGRSAEMIGPEGAHRVGQVIADGWLAASAGEDMDLFLEQEAFVDEQLAHEMTRRKAGSLAAMAFQVGAACATESPSLIEAAGAFGAHVGIVAQLLNDIGGVDPRNSRRGTDLVRRKKTIPVAYTLRVARQEGLQPILDWYKDRPPLPLGEGTSLAPLPKGEAGRRPPGPRTGEGWAGAAREQELAEAIAHLGGLHYAWVIADVHRRQALDALRRLEEVSGFRLKVSGPGDPLEPGTLNLKLRTLRRLVPTLRPRKQEAD